MNSSNGLATRILTILLIANMVSVQVSWAGYDHSADHNSNQGVMPAQNQMGVFVPVSQSIQLPDATNPADMLLGGLPPAVSAVLMDTLETLGIDPASELGQQLISVASGLGEESAIAFLSLYGQLAQVDPALAEQFLAGAQTRLASDCAVAQAYVGEAARLAAANDPVNLRVFIASPPEAGACFLPGANASALFALDLGFPAGPSLDTAFALPGGFSSIGSGFIGFSDTRRYAMSLSEQGVGGVELWTAVTEYLVVKYEGRSDLTIQEKYDAVMLELVSVFVGANSNESNSGDMSGLLGKALFADAHPLINAGSDAGRFQAFLEGITGAYAGGDLDATAGADFNPAFRDGTNNQVFHTMAFTFLGYAVEDENLVFLGNLYHETVEILNGRSVADFNASFSGGNVGAFIRDMRNSDSAEEGFHLLPAVIAGSFGSDDFVAGYTASADDEMSSTVAGGMHTWVNWRLQGGGASPAENLIMSISRSLIADFEVDDRQMMDSIIRFARFIGSIVH